MKVYFRQIYIRAGVEFPFSHRFQRFLSEQMTALVEPSSKFIREYGQEADLVFNISAKKAMRNTEIRGPTRYKKDVEYSVFLPFDVIVRSDNTPRAALGFLFQAIYSVLGLLEIDTERVAKQHESLIEQVLQDPAMFREGKKRGTQLDSPE